MIKEIKEFTNKNKKILGIISVAALVILLAWFFIFAPSSNKNSFTLDSSSLPQVWEFKGLYATPELDATVQKNIDSLKGRLNDTGADTYDLYVSLAQQYMLIGRGKEAYRYLLRAGDEDPGNSLTFQTMGVLMESLGAQNAAEESFKYAVVVQPQIVQNHLALIGYYVRQNTEASVIDAAFAYALEKSGRATNVLKEYAQWLEEEKNISKAITVWEEVLRQIPDDRAVKERINKLKLKI